MLTFWLLATFLYLDPSNRSLKEPINDNGRSTHMMQNTLNGCTNFANESLCVYKLDITTFRGFAYILSFQLPCCRGPKPCCWGPESSCRGPEPCCRGHKSRCRGPKPARIRQESAHSGEESDKDELISVPFVQNCSQNEEKSSAAVKGSSALVHNDKCMSQSYVQIGDKGTHGKEHTSEPLIVGSQSVHLDIPITYVDTLVFPLKTTLETIVTSNPLNCESIVRWTKCHHSELQTILKVVNCPTLATFRNIHHQVHIAIKDKVFPAITCQFALKEVEIVPHNLLKDKITDLLHSAYTCRKSQYIEVCQDEAFWSNNVSNKAVRAVHLIELFNYLIENIYVCVDGSVFKQCVGIPMGTDCAPVVANLFLFAYE